jgi:hypothetical protein
MQIAVRYDDETAVLRPRILTRLLLANERILIFRFSFKNYEGESLGIQQQKIYEALLSLFEIAAECLNICCLDCDARFKLNVGRLLPFRKKSPASSLLIFMRDVASFMGVMSPTTIARCDAVN